MPPALVVPSAKRISGVHPEHLTTISPRNNWDSFPQDSRDPQI